MLKMKKAKFVGVIAGVMALTMVAGMTYAWFVSESDPAVLDVSTALIKISEVEREVTVDTTNLLPGEKVEVDDVGFESASTRESIVKLSFANIANRNSLSWKFPNSDGTNPTISRINALTDAVKAGLIIDGSNVTVDGVVVPTYIDAATKNVYLWLDKPATVGDIKEIDGLNLAVTVPTILGGNTPQGDRNRPEEQEASFTVSYSAYAIQGTKDAALELFPDVAAALEVESGFYGNP